MTTASTHTTTEKLPNALRISRVFKAPPERVYQAYLDPDALAKWIPPNGFTGKVHHLDAKVGGSFRMSFSTISRSWTSAFGGEYLELKPYERIVHTDKFEDPGLEHIELKVTVTFKPVAGGTEMTVVQEGIDKMPKEMSSGAPEGWAQSMENLARLVEAELPF
jgi:uncharacterized protein YndB with AHSA1/START domain